MASDRERLADCPLCAGKTEIRRTRSKAWPMFSAQCTNEDCLASVVGYAEAEVIARWNRRASAPPADVAGLIKRLRAHPYQPHPVTVEDTCDHMDVCNKAADALAALAGERDRLRALVDRGADLLTQWKNCDTQGWAALLVPEMDKLRLDMLLEAPARAALGGSDA